MPITRLDHYSFRTLKLEETNAFYVDIIGLTIGYRPPFAFPGTWLYNGSHAIVHVVGIDPENPAATTDYLGERGDIHQLGSGLIDHLAFVAVDLPELYGRLKNSGLDWTERTVPDQGLHQVFLTDPNGVVIEMNYPASEAQAA